MYLYVGLQGTFCDSKKGRTYSTNAQNPRLELKRFESPTATFETNKLSTYLVIANLASKRSLKCFFQYIEVTFMSTIFVHKTLNLLWYVFLFNTNFKFLFKLHFRRNWPFGCNISFYFLHSMLNKAVEVLGTK